MFFWILQEFLENNKRKDYGVAASFHEDLSGRPMLVLSIKESKLFKHVQRWS